MKRIRIDDHLVLWFLRLELDSEVFSAGALPKIRWLGLDFEGSFSAKLSLRMQSALTAAASA